MICTACHYALSPLTEEGIDPGQGDKRTHHLTHTDFKRSVDEGCYCCNILWRSLSSDEKDLVSQYCDAESRPRWLAALIGKSRSQPPHPQKTYTFNKFATASLLSSGSIYGYQASDYSFQLGIRGVQGAKDSWTWRVPFILQSLDNDSDTQKPDSLESSSSTKSPETFELARKWIADCVTDHADCKVTNAAGSWYPSRLLDCGLSDDPDEAPNCRLIETSVTPPEGPYMTLSHCWGDVDCLKLTTTNYSQMLKTVPYSSLPRLYQDAVEVVRGLGVRYLWIDSICIIQEGDLSADWRQEVSRMCDVYSNSYCNISPTVARNARDTMFNSRHPGLVLPAVVGGSKQSFLVSESRFWDYEVSQAVLNTRAWVLQERLLSPRILHFGRHQLLWECNHKSAAELYPDGIPPNLNLSRVMSFKNWLPKPTTEGIPSIEGYRKWENIITAYTACKLTYPSDKLPAISSIAKILRPVLNDEYVAGLWRRFLECQLLWWLSGGKPLPQITKGRTRGQDDSSPYRCPSWSWASVDGQVNQGPVDVEPSELFIRVSDVHLEYATEDDTGLVKGGWLRLGGVLKLLSLKSFRSPSAHGGPGIWIMTVNGVQLSEQQGEGKFTSYQPHVMLDAFHEDFNLESSKETLYCMIGRIQKAGGIIFVLLLELVDRERGVYRRIGLARGWGDGVKQKLLSLSGEEATFPCEKYDEGGLHYIRVI